MSEAEMAQAVKKIYNDIACYRDDKTATCYIEKFFDNRVARASIGELYEICRRVQHECVANNIDLVRCGDLSSVVQPWKIEYRVRSKRCFD